MTTAARMNNGKPQLSFLLQFPTAVEAFARVKELGAIKYERDNWQLGGKPDWEYLDACLRHVMAFMSGEYYAEDTGCPHLAHAAWNLFALQELNYPGQSHDPELFAQMCEEWAKKKEESKKVGDLKVEIKADSTDLRETTRRIADVLKREIRQTRPFPPQCAAPEVDAEPSDEVPKFVIKESEKLPSMKAIDDHFAEMYKDATALRTLRRIFS